MDPLSLSIGIAGILPLVASAITSAKKYIDTVKSANKSITALLFELELLQSNVTNLNELLKGDALGNSDVKFGENSVLLSCSAACEAKLRHLCTKLGREANGRGRRLLWPFTEKEHQKTMQELRNFTTWMQFALSIDGCRLMSQKSDDVLRLMGQQLDQFKTIESLENDTLQILALVRDQNRVRESNKEKKTRRRVLDWITTAEYHRKHHTIQCARTKGTGSWILGRGEYKAWRNRDGTSNVLWCHGIQGVGKTNLASVIIDDLLDSASSGSSPVAFFYFDYQDQSTQSLLLVLACVLRQILEKLPEIPRNVIERYEKGNKNGRLPLHEYERLLEEVLSGLPRAYLVFDGLDESEHHKGFLQSIERLVRNQNVRLLITSRPHVLDLADSFRNYPKLRIEAHEEDLRTYLRHGLSQGGINEVADEDFVNRLIDKLTQGAEGMFLLPALQLRTILKEPTIGEMEDRMADLSQGLGDAFADTIARIQRLPESRSRLGMSVLLWLTHTPNSMRAAELTDALAIRIEQSRINSKYRPSMRTVLECCQGLVEIDALGFARLAHYAVQEYLSDHSEKLFPRAKATMAVNCLRYLLSNDFQDGPWELASFIESHIEAYPLLVYAASNWGPFAQESETDPEVRSTLFAFFNSPSAMGVANQVRQYSMGRIQRYWGVEECRSFSAIHHASRHGLDAAIARLIASEGSNAINKRTRMGATPVIFAAASGHVLTVKRLLAHGAGPYLMNWYGNALHCAIESGNAGTVRALVNWGMDPNDVAVENDSMSYAHYVLAEDSAEALESLVELGMEKPTYPLFFRAALSGACRIVELMLARSWIDDVDARTDKDRTVLHYAALSGDPTTVRTLLDHGVDIGVVDRGGKTALDWAEEAGDKSVIRMLSDAQTTQPIRDAMSRPVTAESPVLKKIEPKFEDGLALRHK